jgi:hypothetical protein
MSKVVLTNARIIFESAYDFSEHIASITLATVHEILDVTPVETGTIYKKVIAGVGTNTVTFEIHQDFSSGSNSNSIEEFFNGVPPYSAMPIRVGTLVACKVVSDADAPVGATNPEYSFDALVTEWTPLNASVGQLSTISVNWPISGAIVKSITP